MSMSPSKSSGDGAEDVGCAAGGITNSPVTSSHTHSEENHDNSIIECAICMEPCVFPVELTCHHVFCYLCVKGTAVQATQQRLTPRCSICRQDIPSHVLSNPHLKDSSGLFKTIGTNEFQWYYECRSGGWWQFEERLTKDLEAAYSEGNTKCQLLIAGQMYEVDFESMLQYRPNHRGISRRIKRDLATSQKKGIAGIRLTTSDSPSASSQIGTADSSDIERTRGEPVVIPSALVNPSMLQHEDHWEGIDDSESDSEDYDHIFGLHWRMGVIMEDEEFFQEDYTDEDEESGDDDRDTVDGHILSPREGARAPTSRSDRSNTSSLNSQTPPPSFTLGSIPQVVDTNETFAFGLRSDPVDISTALSSPPPSALLQRNISPIIAPSTRVRIVADVPRNSSMDNSLVP